jgi:hypothetical protein
LKIALLPTTPLGRLRLTALVLVPALVAVAGSMNAVAMPGCSFEGDPGPPSAERAALAARLEADVRTLAHDIGRRSEDVPDGLDRAEVWITGELAAAGYAVQREVYKGRRREVANLVAERRGATKPDETLIVGAHYDAAPGTPGADDNASGIAGMLALARAMSSRTPSRTVRFVAWVNEEPPAFWTEEMGSLVNARACRARGDDIRAVWSLETIGYYTDAPGSQKYPSPLDLFYPSTGNFVGFVGAFAHPALVRRTVATFRAHASIPSEGAAMPLWLPGVGWSDHWSYLQVGYPAVMVTDTAPFRNPHYHEASDLPDTLDYARMALVVEGLLAVVAAEAE